MNYHKLTQSDKEFGKKDSEIWVNFDTVKCFFPNVRSDGGNETMLRFVDDTVLGVHETIDQIVQWINPA